MNLWLRMICLFLMVTWRDRLPVPFGVSKLRFRVWPSDLDISLHMNNGRYWTLMDLGRTDLMLRAGLWRVVMRRGWIPVISQAAIRFRRELRPFQRFDLETRIVTWSDTRFVIEQRMLGMDGVCVASALVQGGLYDRGRRSFVPVCDLLGRLGVRVPAPAISPEIAAFLSIKTALS